MRINDSIFLGAIVPELDNGALVVQQNKRILFLSLLSRLIEVVVRGVPPLSLPDAIANSLSYVKAFGDTEQRKLPVGYQELEYIESTGTQYIDTGIIATNWDWSVEFEMSVPQAGDMFFGAGRGLWSSADWGAQFGLANTSGNTNWGAGSGGMNVVISNLGVRTDTFYNYKMTKEGLYINGELKSRNTATESFSNSDLSLWICKTNNLGTSGYNKTGSSWKYVRIYNADTALVFNGVPAKNPDGKIGMYDKVSGEFFENKGTGDFVAGPVAVPTPDAPMDIVCNNGVLRIQGAATGTVTQAGDPTPTAPIYPVFYQKGNLVLRAVDGYADTYDATTQTITRNIGVHIYDGTESFSALSTPNTFRFGFTDRGKTGVNPLCSHYPAATITLAVINMPNKTIKGHATAANNFYIKDSRFDTADELKAWLADQYNAGTPVIIYYVLETPMTESFTPSVYADGTVETIKDSLNNTATTEMLLKVGNYQDAQSIIDGVVTRNVGVKVLDGTEAWFNNLYPQPNAYRISWKNATATLGTIRYSGLFCTHFEDGGSFSAAAPNKMFFANDLNINFPKTSDFDTRGKCLQWLADQYAAGTPVIIVFPLATPTTESVTGQTLQVQADDNTLEITQASLSGLELEAKYEKEGA